MNFSHPFTRPARAITAALLALALLAPPSPAAAGELPADGPRPLAEDEPGSLALVWEAWAVLNGHYLEPAALDPQRLLTGAALGWTEGILEPADSIDRRRGAHRAIRGMVRTLGDPNTAFLTPEERRVAITGFAGRLEGIGACLELRDGRPTVIGLVHGGPAERAGLLRGDPITAIDDRPVEGLTLRDAVLGLRGASGTWVRLATPRAELEIGREEIRLISARGIMAEPPIGLLRVVAFTEGTDGEAGAALEALGRRGARALILDLRGNLGGLLRPAVELASRLTPIDPIAWQEDGRGGRYAYERPPDRPALDWPIVVLMDRWTASASEVVALALRDSGRARLIGRPTYGKGTIQYLFELSDGSGLHLTAARWLGPAGRPLEPGGLVPDVWAATERTESADPAAEEAVRALRPLLGTPPEAPVGRIEIPTDDCSPADANAA